MNLKYVGPKPIISHTGIEFDNNKDDKYNYLNIVVQLLQALSSEHLSGETFVYHESTSRITQDQLASELKKFCPNIDSLMEKENHSVEEEIEHQLKRAHENVVLSQADKETLENNINIMHDYLIQRSINKAVYYCAVRALAEALKKSTLHSIIMPMFQKFAHVLHSVQGTLKVQKYPIDTKLEIYKEDGKLLVKLQLLNNR